ncbi:hypothetical protein NA56DRAFT_300504 [Hyaloscypha hepaticicola]|uniref:Uncharacterized protein n=1 Tax=Hyaloscypha hepaticicola TaxID=2082293 RepID=A0A2J6QL17_9HELO|nr:hypothetical protein NA56DRAFT_300504 [Hyaloscypha hepaticicola]
MQIYIHVYSYFLTIIRSCIVKVVKLFLFLRGLRPKSGCFGGFLIQKSRHYTCLPLTLASADCERSEQRRTNRLLYVAVR